MASFDRASFAASFAVPRGTMDKFDRYADMLIDWQSRMNLVGPATLADLWTRHFADSAQLIRHTRPGQTWLDIGAGGGFPGLVLALLGHGTITLVDSVGKKCRFLDAVVSDLGLANVTIHNSRIEALPPLRPAIITARAAAALDILLDWALPHARRETIYVFPKGKRWNEEISAARRRFLFDFAAEPSMTDDSARILLVRNVRKRR